MYKQNQIAPFFSMSAEEFNKLLKEIDLVYKLEETVNGVFRIRSEDLAVIEIYINIKKLFIETSYALNKLEEILIEKSYLNTENYWIKKIKDENGYE